MTARVLQARATLGNAELLCSAEQVQSALRRLAGEITEVLHDRYPLVLAVMGGAVVFAGQLLPLLEFPLEFDYVHLSRYGEAQQGGELRWKVAPGDQVRGREVLVLDDILDEGVTLAALRQRLLDLGATRVYCAVFADKRHGRDKTIVGDFVGLEVPNRFVFGYGMDVDGAWRNLPAIYAVKEEG